MAFPASIVLAPVQPTSAWPPWKTPFKSTAPPDIFNTDQGSQFTSLDFTDVLKDRGIKISMDGKGAWMDNVFIERLWWSLKYERSYGRPDPG